jgi:hypothetical protein
MTRLRSTYKKKDLFTRTDEHPVSKDSQTNKENLEAFKYLGNLRRIRDEYVKLVEENMVEKARFNQAEIAALHEDATLLLNDDTRINNSFINESQQKQTYTGYSNTPSKTPTRFAGRSRSGNKHRRDDSITNSQLIGSIDRQEEKTPTTSVYGGNDSVFLKSHDFPKMLKRQKQRNYTKVLIPFLVAPESQRQRFEEQDTILDLYKLHKIIKVENGIEHFEGTCLIRNLKRPVLIKRSPEQKNIMQEILTQLVFYENEISFRDNCLAKMKDFFNTGELFHVVYDKPGDPIMSLMPTPEYFSDKQMQRMISNICSALTCMHSLGIIHAKVNSDSICYSYISRTDAYSLSLSDFERCFFESDVPAKIEADCCSAPEIIFQAGVVDRKADYWSLGCMIFFLLTGKHLFGTKNRAGLVYLVNL